MNETRTHPTQIIPPDQTASDIEKVTDDSAKQKIEKAEAVRRLC
jgi:hypothetical protein